MRRFLLGAAALACLAAAPPARAATLERARYLMGTLAAGVAEHADTARAAAALEAAFDEIARLERVMTSWRDDSELARLNAARGAPVACSPDLFAVLDSSVALARLTGGAFDPTTEPLARAWDMRGAGRLPSHREIAAARGRVGWTRLRLDPATRAARLDGAGAGVDLGGIGKGFALDRAADAMRRAGVSRGLLNLGGEIRAWSDGAPWPVSIAHPERRLRPAVRITVTDAAVSTSAQAERGADVRGRHWGHVLDPRTGRPAPTRASVTVVAPRSTRADALATALLVLGREKAESLVLTHPGIGVLWLEPEGERVKAWRWNSIAAVAEDGVAVRWMNETPIAEGATR